MTINKKAFKNKNSRFNLINENQSEYFKNQPIKTEYDYKRLITAGTYLLSNLIEGPYNIRANKGSLTFQHEFEQHRVVSFTIDYENQLADKMDIYSRLRNNHHYKEHPQDFDEMVIVFVELTNYDPFVRDAIRKELDEHYLYCNPTKQGYNKVHVFPQKGHHYDVIFLPKGPCKQELFFDEELFAEIIRIKDQNVLEESDDNFILNVLNNK